MPDKVVPSEAAVAKAIAHIRGQGSSELLTIGNWIRETLDARGETKAARGFTAEALLAHLSGIFSPPCVHTIQVTIDAFGLPELRRAIFDADAEHAAHAEAVHRINAEAQAEEAEEAERLAQASKAEASE